MNVHIVQAFSSCERVTTVEVVELWTVFHEHYSLLGQSRNMGRFISTDHRLAYKDSSVCRSSHFYEAVYFCLAKELARRKNCLLSVTACVAVLSDMTIGHSYS